MMLGVILFWVLVIVLVVWLARGGWEDLGLGRGGGEQGPDALEILERRLAEGDLTVEEYRERRAALARD